MASEITKLINELKWLYTFWTGLLFCLNFLILVGELNATYVASPGNAINYNIQLILYLLKAGFYSMLEGAILTIITAPFKPLLKKIGL